MRVLLLVLTAALLLPAPAGAQQVPPSSPPTAGVADFKLIVDPGAVSVRRGSTARIAVRVVPEPGFEGKVYLVSSLLYDTAMTFDPPWLEAGSGTPSFLTIAPTRNALKGAYVVTITALGSGISRVATVRVSVR